MIGPIVKLYYTIEGGKPLELINAHIEATDKIDEAAKVFVEEVGGSHSVTNQYFDAFGYRVSGVVFKAKRAPKNWKQMKRVGRLSEGEIAACPVRNTAEGKALAERIGALRCANPHELYGSLGYSGERGLLISNVMRMYRPIAGKVGGKWVAIIPVRVTGELPEVPEGATRIEEWEFKKMAHEAEVAAAK